jgi:hypothetical protein
MINQRSKNTDSSRRGELLARFKRITHLLVSLSPCLLVSLSPCLLVFLAGCGKVGDPLPPIPRAPLMVDNLQVSQDGAEIRLSFPFNRTPRSARLQRIDVYRLAESSDAPRGVSQETFAARASVIKSIPADQIAATSSTIYLTDPLDLKTTPPDTRYRYAVRLINLSGAAADFSNYAMIEPLVDLASPPTDLEATQQETEIEFHWTAPASNEDGTSPANLAGYNLYRKTGAAYTRINPEPLNTTSFTLRDFQFDVPAEYIVRAISFRPNDASLTNTVESSASRTLTHTPKDAFPPTAPTSVTIASINGAVSLFWPLNPEPDVAGYFIYRSEDEKTWVKLNNALHKTSSFRDERVQVGKLFYYQITAVDKHGNESPRSATVSETVAQ